MTGLYKPEDGHEGDEAIFRLAFWLDSHRNVYSAISAHLNFKPGKVYSQQ